MDLQMMKKWLFCGVFWAVIFNAMAVFATSSDPWVYDSEYKVNYTQTGESSFSYPLGLLASRIAKESYSKLKGDDYKCANTASFNGPQSLSMNTQYYDCALLEAGFLDTALVKFNNVSLGGVDPFEIAGQSIAGNNGTVNMLNLARSSTQAVVGYKYVRVDGKKRRIVVIAFRGTQFGDIIEPEQFDNDLAIDLTAGTVPYSQADPNNLVHEGFYTSTKVMESLEGTALLDGKTLAELITGAPASGDLFLVVGHSLGGGIATIYSARLLDRGVPRDNLLVYTFGSPSVGNANFKNVFFNEQANATPAQLAKKLNLHRVRNQYDAIPYSAYLAFVTDSIPALGASAVAGNLVPFFASLSYDFAKSFMTGHWPFEHIGYTKVFSDGTDVTASFNVGGVSLLDRTPLASRALSDHDMYVYYANIKVLGFNNPPAPRTDITPPSITASPSSGTYYNETTVALSSDDPSASIYVSFDPNSDPEKSTVKCSELLVSFISCVYDGPFTLGSASSFKAIAVDRQGNTSAPKSFSYDIRYIHTNGPYFLIQLPDLNKANFDMSSKTFSADPGDKIRISMANDVTGKIAALSGMTVTAAVILPDGTGAMVPGTVVGDYFEFTIDKTTTGQTMPAGRYRFWWLLGVDGSGGKHTIDSELQQVVGTDITSTGGTPSTSGLVAHWSFDDCTATDVSGNGHDGTSINNPVCVDSVIGKGLQFNGTSYVKVPWSEYFRSNNFSICSWHKNSDSIGNILSIPSQSLTEDALEFGYNSSNGLVGGYVYQNNYFYGNAGINKQYKHLCFTKSGSSGMLWVNGIVVGTTNTFPSSMNFGSPRSILLGADDDAGNDGNGDIWIINGILDEVSYYNRAISASEIQSLYNTGYTELLKKLPTATFLSENLPDGSYQVGTATKTWRFKSGANAITGLKAVQTSGKTTAGLGINATEISIGDVAANSEFLVNLPINPAHDATDIKSSYWSLVDGSGQAVTITNSKNNDFWLKLHTNRAPTFSQLQLESVGGKTGQPLCLPLLASDPDGDTLNYSVISGGGSVVDATCMGVTGKTYLNSSPTVGVTPVKIRITDIASASADKEIFTIAINENGTVKDFFNDLKYANAATDQQKDQYRAINYLALNGIVIGSVDPNDPNGRVFKVNDIANQAEALSMLMKAANIRGITTLDAEPRFLPNLEKMDASTGAYYNFTWVMPCLLKAEQLGLIPSADTFEPNKQVTRQWFASILAGLLNLNPPVDLIANMAEYSFADAADFATTDDYDKARAAAFFGFMWHLGDTAIFNPKDAMIRADVAVVVSKVLRQPTLDGITTTGLSDQSVFGKTLPSLTHGQSFSVTGLKNPNAHRMLDDGAGNIREDDIFNSVEYINVKVIRPGVASYLAGEKLASALAASPVIVPTNPPDISFTDERTLLVLVEAIDPDGRNYVRNTYRMEYGVIFPDRDGDGVRDDLDLWPDNPLYAYDANANGIPDNADALWGLASRNGSDVVNINGQSMTLINAVLNGNLANDKTAPITTPSVAAGTYQTAQSVTLTANETATIRCTTDGSAPTATSPVCSSAIPVNSSMTIKYFAVDLAGNAEAYKEAAYTLEVVNGACGSSNNATFSSKPSTNLCAAGSATTVTGNGSWTWNCTGLNNGTTATCSANIDTTGPALTLSTLADAARTNNATLNISGTVTDPSGVASLTINSTPVIVANSSFSTAITLQSGANAITAVATDTLGNITSNNRTITLDQAAPSLAITAPSDNSITAQAVADITGTVSETSSVTVKLGSGTAQNATINGSVFSSNVNLVAGLNTITIIATDTAANTSQVVRTVTYDNTTPSLAITSPNQDITTTKNSLTISGTVSDPQTAVSVTISHDGQNYTPAVTNGAFSQQLGFAAAKTYAITVTAADQAGNTATVRRNIIRAASGDITGDGSTNLADALKALRIAVGLASATAAEIAAADVAPIVNGVPAPDGIIDIADALVLLEKTVGLYNW